MCICELKRWTSSDVRKKVENPFSNLLKEKHCGVKLNAGVEASLKKIPTNYRWFRIAHKIQSNMF